jgi:hypothetical protein
MLEASVNKKKLGFKTVLMDTWNETELKTGKAVKIKKFSKDKLEQLRKFKPGKWYKVYDQGTDGLRNLEPHYFQHELGAVFNVKIKHYLEY